MKRRKSRAPFPKMVEQTFLSAVEQTFLSAPAAGGRDAHPPFGLIVFLNRHSGAPLRPGTTTLRKVFRRAWDLAAHHSSASEHRSLSVDIIFVDDQEIACLNKSCLGVSGPTDVLSFPMGEWDPERNTYNLGEIVVSFETAKREAGERKISVEQELSRYCVHGFLHLLGYDDATETQRSALFEIQEKGLKAIKNSELLT